MIDPGVVDDYSRWLHKMANELGRPADHDDLVQEGRIAMWRALETYDESLGSLPAWLTGAARQRMRDIAWGKGQPFGHEAVRGEKPVDEGPSLDAMTESEIDGILGYVEEAYADGELADAISRLSLPQRQYVFLRFWAGLNPRSGDADIRALVAQYPVLGQRWHWQRARAALQAELEKD